ncbi:MAG: hypothetical protein ACTSQI_21585 [Candidatus Helarchaeota archaeon]
MRYYCTICEKDITRGEYFYSRDKFNRALCREHQELERKKQASSFQLEKQAVEPMELKPFEPESREIIVSNEKSTEIAPKGRWKSLGKKIIAKMGKGLKEGVKNIANFTKNRIQLRKWKDSILRRMTMRQLEQFCFEKKISTSKRVLKKNARSNTRYWKTVQCSKGDLVSRLKRKASLETIISFAKRNNINIREILIDIDRTRTEWKVKELTKRIKEQGSSMVLELEKAIYEFVPMRRYNQELYYQDTLASFLKSRFSDVEIEVKRGSTRPDIVVNGIAIEVKGPTNHRDLQSIADKCLRYKQYFPKLICVLFNVTVTQHQYEDWLQGMKKHHPDVIIIKISP